MRIDLTTPENIVKWTTQQLRKNIHTEVLKAEQTALTFPDNNPTDLYIGRIAYKERDAFNKDNINNKKYAESDSFIKTRRRVIRDILIALADPKYQDSTINTYVREFLVIFDWCDANLSYDFTESITNASDAYHAYTNKLIGDLKTGHYTPTSTSGLQLLFRQLLKIIFPNDNLEKDVFEKTKMMRRGQGQEREVPDRANVDYQLYMLINIFEQISSQIISHSDFPLHFKCEEYDSHIIPTIKGGYDYISTPFNNGKESPYFDYGVGKVLSKQEVLKSKYPPPANPSYSQKSAVYRASRKLESIIEEANKDRRCKVRVLLATLALSSYYLIFLHATGMNHQPLSDLKFDGEYEISKSTESKEYRVLKFRSGGREVSFTLGRIAIKLFKKYLSLRKWMLNGVECDYLFFSISDGAGRFNSPRKIKSNIAVELYDRLFGRFIPDGLERLGSSKLRKFKSDVLSGMGEDITTSAQLLQHSNVETTAEYYADGNQHTQQKEMSEYWDAFSSVIVDAHKDYTKTASGACNDYGEPIPVQEQTAIQPSCNIPQGCLFCQHYIIHSDEEDLYKIMSLKYFIETIIEEFPDIEHVVNLYAGLLERIDAIISSMKGMSEEVSSIVEKVRKKVFDEHRIHNFWDLRLQRFDRLGVVVV